MVKLFVQTATIAFFSVDVDEISCRLFVAMNKIAMMPMSCRRFASRVGSSLKES